MLDYELLTDEQINAIKVLRTFGNAHTRAYNQQDKLSEILGPEIMQKLGSGLDSMAEILDLARAKYFVKLPRFNGKPPAMPKERG